MKKLNDLQKLTFEFVEIESIKDVGYQECVDIEVEDDHSFTLSNKLISHNSAKQGLSDGLGRAEIGYFSTRGVPLNAYEVAPQKIAANEELENIIKCLKLHLKEETQPELTYEKIVLANDADCFEEHTKVLTHNGNWKPVIDIIEKVKNEYIKIKIKDDYIYLGLTHKCIVYRDGKVQEVLAINLKNTDKFLKRKRK